MLDRVEALTLEFLDGRADLFAARVDAGRIVDGHGDLMADDIYCLSDGPRILDCIEFDDRLRWLDQLDDAAFLAMDLEYLGATDLARAFLDWYAEFAADPAPVTLRHHFVAYRAFVRAKVACLRYLQGEDSARDEAQRHATLALAHLRAGGSRLVVVGGLPGTGKSTLSGALADALGCRRGLHRPRTQGAGRSGPRDVGRDRLRCRHLHDAVVATGLRRSPASRRGTAAPRRTRRRGRVLDLRRTAGVGAYAGRGHP